MEQAAPRVSVREFGRLPDGRVVRAWQLANSRGLRMEVLDYGGIIRTLDVPDRDGRTDDVVLGFDTLERYLSDSPYFGAIVGRCANRIGAGRFTIDGVTHHVTINDGANHLHGGLHGFHAARWSTEPFTAGDASGLALRHVSPDGTDGYPGSVDTRVTYTLTDANRLIVHYRATTDRPTPVNISQHSYFNLAGAARGDVLSHELTIAASHFTPVDEGLIPEGALEPVEGTPFDFRDRTSIGSRIGDRHPQLLRAGGYDHNWVLEQRALDTPVIVVHDPVSGRIMSVTTSEPGVQFYSGNFLDGVQGKGGVPYGRHAGLCLETQHFPDSPNQPAFPGVILRPGEQHDSTTIFDFTNDRGAVPPGRGRQ